MAHSLMKITSLACVLGLIPLSQAFLPSQGGVGPLSISRIAVKQAPIRPSR